MQMGVKRVISIHALREEGDHLPDDEVSHALDFYPRPPRGGRHQQGLEKMWSRKFLSTPSARRATQDFTEAPQTLAISIHALREEGDSSSKQP